MMKNCERMDWNDLIWSIHEEHYNQSKTCKSGESYLYEWLNIVFYIYRQISNIGRALVGSKIVNHSDVVGALPVGAAPTTSSFST